MSQDFNTVTTSTSWFSRLGGAIKGVLVGFVLIVASIILLSWNEGRSIQSIRSNNEGARVVTSVSANQVDAANNGKLVHLTAPAVAQGVRQDEQLGISTPGLLLARSVEYFQWIETSNAETRTKLGGGQETVTTYSYKTEWSSMAQDSSGFNQPQGHQNPAPVIKDTEVTAPVASLGAFQIDQAGLDQLSADTSLALTAEQVQAAGTALSRPTSLTDNVLYVGENIAAPKVGDMKITYRIVPQNTVLSVIGAQSGNTLRPYTTKANSNLLMVRTGTASAAEMFQAAKAANQTLSWILRGVGVVLAIAGFGMILGPLGVLGDVVPFIGSLVRMGTGLIAGVLGVGLSLIVIALSWIVFRPVFGIVLLAIAAAIIGGVFYLRRKKVTEAPKAA